MTSTDKARLKILLYLCEMNQNYNGRAFCCPCEANNQRNKYNKPESELLTDAY